MSHHPASAFAIVALALYGGCVTENAPRGARAPAEPPPVAFVLGPRHFQGDDWIEIDEVLASSPGFAAGDRVIVRGRYELRSRDQAGLVLHLTHLNGGGWDEIYPEQSMVVDWGSGDFELEIVLRREGALHVSFYDLPGAAFGGVYFGSREQMREAYAHAGGAPAPRTTPFVLGPLRFPEGDRIRIEEVLATSPDLDLGDRVIVRGSYALGSRERAVLALAMSPVRPSEGMKGSLPESVTAVTKGAGRFELECVVLVRGALHVSFYDEGTEFGGLYFGTQPQMSWIGARQH